MAIMTNKLGVELMNKLVGLTTSDVYDPKRDRKLFGDFTDELVREISGATYAPEVVGVIEETAKNAQQDESAEFSKMTHQNKIKELIRVLHWAEDTTDLTLGQAPQVSARILKSIYIPDVSHVKTDTNAPELVNAGPLTEAELSFFENAPASATMSEYNEERNKRTPTKDTLPETYDPLTWNDIGKDADVQKVINAVRFFLGNREVKDGKKTYSRRVKEPPLKRYLADLATDEAENEGESKKGGTESAQKVKDLIFRLLGHVRDEKYKAWDEARRKMVEQQHAINPEPLSPVEKTHAMFYGENHGKDSDAAKTLGRTKAQLKHAVDNIFNKSVTKSGDILGDHKVVAINAGALNASIKAFKRYLQEMGKERKSKDDSGKDIAVPTNLQTDLKSLKNFINTGAHKPDMQTYKDLLGQLNGAISDANLTEDQRDSLYGIFPSASGEERSMKTVNDWISGLEERSGSAKKRSKEIEDKIKLPEEDRGSLKNMIELANNKRSEAYEAYRKAHTLSEDLAPKILRDLRSPFLVRGADLSNKEIEELADRVYKVTLEKYAPRYGEENVKRVFDYAKKYMLAKHEEESTLEDIKSSKDGELLYNLDTAKKNEENTKRLLDGALSLVVEKSTPGDKNKSYDFSNDSLKDIHKKADGLVNWVFNTRDESIKSANFKGVRDLIQKLDDIRKKLVKLSRTSKAAMFWDYGTGWMYRDKDAKTPAAFGEGKFDEGALLSDDPEKWISDLQNDSRLNFLETKTDELFKAGKGKPETVAGPSFSQIPVIYNHIVRLISKLKNFDPNAVKDKMINEAISRANIGYTIRSKETQKKKKTEEKERQKAYESENIKPIEMVKAEPAAQPQPEATPKSASSLSQLVVAFMDRVAAMREATFDFLSRTAKGRKIRPEILPAHTKREKKTGPVYLNAFFIDPDGADEFILELERNGFDFVNSLAMEDEALSGKTPKELEEKMPGPEKKPEQAQPARGHKFDIDEAIVKTMMKGSSRIQEHILKNKDRMADVLGKRLKNVDDQMKDAKRMVDVYTAEVANTELRNKLSFLKELASFIRNPEKVIKDYVPLAFPEKAWSMRQRELKNQQKDVEKIIEKVKRRKEFDLRRNKLKAKYESMGIDPETRDDYRYADKVVKQVDNLKKFMSLSELYEMYEDLPEYDKINRQIRGIRSRANKKGQMTDAESDELYALEQRVSRLDAYLSKKESFKNIQKLYPAESAQYTDPETEALYKKQVKDVPEDVKSEKRYQYEQRMKELDDLSSWDEFKSWIRKIQKAKPSSETTSKVSLEITRQKALIESLKKRISKAEGEAKSLKGEDATKAKALIDDLKKNLTSAESSLSQDEKKLVTMTSRKKGLGDTQFGKTEPKELVRLRKEVADAEEQLKNAPENERENAKTRLEGLKGKLTSAEEDFKKTKALREKGVSDIGLGEYEPKEGRRLWDRFMDNVKNIVVLGMKKDRYPKMLFDLANENVLSYVAPDEFLKTVSDMERRLSEAGVKKYLVLKNLFGSEGDWNTMKSSIEKRLDSLKTNAEDKKKVLGEARKKLEELKKSTPVEPGEDEQNVVTEAESDVKGLENDISYTLENEKALRGLMEEIDSMYSKQKELSKASEPGLSKNINEVLSKPLPKPTMTDAEMKQTVEQYVKSKNRQKIIDFVLDVDNANKPIQNELEILKNTKSSVDKLYGDSPERQEMYRKVDDRKKELSELLVSDPREYYVNKVVEGFKSRMKEMSPEQESKIRKELTEHLEKKIPGSRWKAYEEEEKKKETSGLKPKMVIEKYLQLYPLSFGGESAIRAVAKSTVDSLSKKADGTTDSLGFKELVRDAKKYESTALQLGDSFKKFVVIGTTQVVIRSLEDVDKMENRFVNSLSTVNAYIDFANETRAVVDSAANKLEASIPKDTQEWKKSSAEGVKKLEEMKKEIDDFWSEIKKDILEYRKNKNLKLNLGKAQPLKPEESDPFWSTRTRYEDMPKAQKGVPGRTKRKTDYPLQKDTDPEWGKPAPVDESIPEAVMSKTASEDDDGIDKSNIENWLKSSPRKYLEDLSRIGINDWDLIESLYGEKKAEYRDLVRGNQMIIDGPEAKERVKKMMEEVDRKAKELARIESLKDMRIPIGGQMVKVSDVGDVFNRELSSYLSKKNTAQMKLSMYQTLYDRLMQESAAYKEFVEIPEDFDTKPVMERGEEDKAKEKMEPTERETQAITDQFYRGLFWYLQDYWKTRSGKESMFGSRESPEFSKLYDATKAMVGVRSTPVIQKVILAGSQARKHLRDVKNSIRGIATKLKRIDVDPSAVIERIKNQYGLSDKNFTSMEDITKEEERVKRNIPTEPTQTTGVHLYFLMKYRDQLESLLESKNAMYEILREVVPAEYKVSVLEAIKSKTADKNLIGEIDKRIKIIREDAEALAERKTKDAEKDIGKAVLKGIDTVKKSEILQGAIEETPQLTEESVDEEDKQASYMNRPGFDLGIFYGKVLQDKIASMAARYLKNRLES
jgi:hypothetical protein